MKKCKYCQSEIDKKAKVCPVCKRKLTSPLKKSLSILVGIIIIIMGISSLANTPTNNEDTKKYITLDEFNKIENGMSYEEVKNIVGSDGTVMSNTEINGYTDIIYYWYGTDKISNANFNFQNGKLVNKTQVGLK